MSAASIKILHRIPDWAWSPVRALAHRLSPGGRRGTLTILIYHRVQESKGYLDYEQLSAADLDWQMYLISKIFTPLPLQEAIDRLFRGTLPPRALAVTFDDGYADNLTVALPVLERYGINATLFVAGIGLQEGRLWNDKLIEAVSRCEAPVLDLTELGLGRYPLARRSQRHAATDQLLEKLKPLHPERQRALLDRLIAISGVTIEERLILTEDQVREINQKGVEIGCHTMNHPMLSKVDLEYAREDIHEAKRELARIIDAPISLFAYPYGKPSEHFRPEHERLVESLGFRAAVSTAWGANNRYSDRFALKRFTPWDDNPLKFLVRLLWNYQTSSRTVAYEDLNKGIGCLLVTSIFPPINGGSAVVYEKLAYYNPDHEVMVLAPRYHCATREYLDGWQTFDQRMPFPVRRLKLLRPWVIQSRSLWHSLYLMARYDLPLKVKVLFTTLRIIRKHRVKTLCIGELNSLSWLGAICRRLTGVKVINYIHGEEVTTATPYRRFGRNRRRYLERADSVVAVSQFTKRYLVDHYGLPPEKIQLIPNGVDVEQFSPGDKSPRLVDRYGLEGSRVLMTVGRLVPRKGIDKTIEALPLLLPEFPDLHYLIVGTGPYREELGKLVDRLGLSAQVTFAGRVAEGELAQHYQLCDIFLMPNREMPDKDTEGFGLVFLEANACSKPVIGGLAGGAVEAVQHERNGLSVDGENPRAIAAAVKRILTEPGLAERLAAEGLVLARESSFHNCARQFQRLYQGLVEG